MTRRFLPLAAVLGCALVGCSREGKIEQATPTPLPGQKPGGAPTSTTTGLSIASQAMTRLDPTYKDWTVRETALDSLTRIGPAAVPDLVNMLRGPDKKLRASAAQALARIGPAARAAVPDLIAALEDPDETVRKTAIRALGQIGPDSAPAIPALIEAIRAPEPVKVEHGA